MNLVLSGSYTKMKSLKTFINENYKLPVIQTVFGASSSADKEVKEKESSKKTGVNFDPIMNDSIIKEEIEHDGLGSFLRGMA